MLAEAKRDGADEEHQGPVDSRAKRGTVRLCTLEPDLLCRPSTRAVPIESLSPIRVCPQAHLDETARMILEAQERALKAQRIKERGSKRSRVEEAAAPAPAAEPLVQATTRPERA